MDLGHVLGAERGRDHDVAGDHRIGEQSGELGQVVGLPGPQQQPGGLDLGHGSSLDGSLVERVRQAVVAAIPACAVLACWSLAT